MTEQAVKDAKVKRDAAQADLDKAVADTKDEIAKADAAVKDAAPEKSEPEPAKPAPEPAEPMKPEPPVVHQAPSLYPPTSPTSIWPKVVIGVVIVLAVLAFLHFKGRLWVLF